MIHGQGVAPLPMERLCSTTPKGKQMLALLCELALATTGECNTTLVRTYAPAPFTPTAITVVRSHSSPHIDVVYPPEFYTIYAPVLNDNAGDGQ